MHRFDPRSWQRFWLATRVHLVWACLVAACLLPGRALAIGEVTGRIGGYVSVEATGDGLAGVTLAISSKELIGGTQTVTTNDDGSYIFQNLPPGTYELRANIEGFAPVLQRNISVNTGQQSAVDIKLQIQATPQVNETYRVIEKKNPVLNQESAAAVTTLNNQQLTNSPSFRQAQGVAQLTPGVSQGTDKVSVRGGLGRSNRFLIDGLDTTDIVTGGITSPINFDAIEQFEVVVGAMDAEYNSLGLVQNMVSRSGGNKFQVDASVILQPSWVAAPTRYAANSPLQDSNLLYDTRPQPQRLFYSGNLNFGGPIIKNKLWFYTSFQLNYSRVSTAFPAVPWYGINDPYDRPTDTYTYLGRLKLTWQATSSTRIALSFNLDRNFIRNLNAITTLLPEADRRIDRGGEWLVLLWDTLITPKLLFQMQAGATFKGSSEDTIRLLGNDPDHVDAPHTISSRGNLFNGYTYLNSPDGWNVESKWNVQLSPSLLYTAQGLGGSHNIKGGVQFAYMRYEHNVGRAGGATYADSIPGLPCDPNNPLTYSSCSQVTTYPESTPIGGKTGAGYTTTATAYNVGVYIQDRYTVKRWLTIVPGFRVDTGILIDYQGNTLATLVGFGPRLSVIYDLTHDRSTLLKAHYGRSNDVGNAFIADRGNPSQMSSLQNWNPNTNKFDLVSKSGGPSGQTFGTNLSPPKVDEVGVGIHRGVFDETAVGIDYTHRKYGNQWVNEETNQIWDTAGQRVVGYANGTAQRIFKANTPDDAQRTYDGLDLWVSGTPGGWNITASYTLAYSTGTVTDFFDTYKTNPRLNPLFNGSLPDNYRHYLKGFVSYTFPFGFTAGSRLQYLSGAPQWKVFQSPQDNSFSFYRSPRGIDTGTNTNDPSTYAEFKLPDQFNLDIQLLYNLEKLTGQRIDVTAMLFNVLNLATATRIDNRDGATFGAIQGRNGNFFAEFVLRYRY